MNKAHPLVHRLVWVCTVLFFAGSAIHCGTTTTNEPSANKEATTNPEKSTPVETAQEQPGTPDAQQEIQPIDDSQPPEPTPEPVSEKAEEAAPPEMTPEKSGTGILFTGSMRNFLGQTPIAGAKFCLVEPKGTCVTSGADGKFVMNNAPDAKEWLFSVEKQGFSKAYQGLTKGQNTHVNFNLIPTNILPVLAGAVNVKIKPGTGIVIMTAQNRVDGGEKDISMKISSQADGPFFLSPQGQPDPKLKGTGSRGFSFFVNVPTGDQTITTFGHGKQECQPLRVWAGAKSQEFRIKVFADAMTYFGVLCLRKRTRKAGETCIVRDTSKPDYEDCVKDHNCTSGKCVAGAKTYASCLAKIGCIEQNTCVGTNSTDRYCLQNCSLENPNCPQSFICYRLSSGNGACIQTCQKNDECKSYGKTCSPIRGSKTKYCL